MFYNTNIFLKIDTLVFLNKIKKSILIYNGNTRNIRPAGI